MIKQLPNFVTLINLFCGCAAITCLYEGYWQILPYFLIVGFIADYSDGFLARLLHATSPLGKELDSLADMVSFGVLPAAMCYHLLRMSYGLTDFDPTQAETWYCFSGFLLAVFAGYRLGKFNVDTRQTEQFIGLNTPATTIFVFGIFLIVRDDLQNLREVILQPYLLHSMVLVLSYLLVSELPMFSFKFKHLRWQGNAWRFVFLGVSLILLLLGRVLALPLIIGLYVVFSLLQYAWMRAPHTAPDK